MSAVIEKKSPFNVANAILALSIGILVIVVAVPVLLIFINSFWVDGQFNLSDVVKILKQRLKKDDFVVENVINIT